MVRTWLLFANEICDYPVLLSLLEMFHGECGRVPFRRRPHPKRSSDSWRAVTLATKTPIVEDGKKFLTLFSCQPVSNPECQCFLTPFTRRMPAARSGLRSPQSAAS